MKRIPVQDFMNDDPATVPPDASLVELVNELRRRSVRSAAVTDSERRLLGVVSETDVFLKEKGVPFSLEKVPTLLGRVIGRDQIAAYDLSKNVKVREVMTRDVVTVEPEDTLERVARLMYRKKLTLLPVVDEGRLVGEVRRIHVLQLIYR